MLSRSRLCSSLLSFLARLGLGLALLVGTVAWCRSWHSPDEVAASALNARENHDPDRNWRQVDPATQGLDPIRLREAIRYLSSHGCAEGTQNLVITRNGQLVWAGPGADRMYGVYSCTKSFTSTVLGLLIDDGKCTLETRASDVLPELAASYREVTLRHFATMTSGYRARWDEPEGEYVNGPSMTPFVPAAAPLFQPPGSGYAYWDSAMNVLARALTRIAGEPLEDLFRRRIADPIGMDPDRWEWGTYGSIQGLPINGGAGNHKGHVLISAREMARFGHLYLNRGRWKDRQILSEKWIAEATTPQVPADHELRSTAFDGRGVYAYNWWANGIGPNGKRKWPGAPAGTFAATGFHNNDLFVIPEWRMVVVRLGRDQYGCEISDETYATFLALLGRARLDAPADSLPQSPAVATSPGSNHRTGPSGAGRHAAARVAGARGGEEQDDLSRQRVGGGESRFAGAGPE